MRLALLTSLLLASTAAAWTQGFPRQGAPVLNPEQATSAELVVVGRIMKPADRRIRVDKGYQFQQHFDVHKIEIIEVLKGPKDLTDLRVALSLPPDMQSQLLWGLWRNGSANAMPAHLGPPYAGGGGGVYVPAPSAYHLPHNVPPNAPFVPPHVSLFAYTIPYPYYGQSSPDAVPPPHLWTQSAAFAAGFSHWWMKPTQAKMKMLELELPVTELFFLRKLANEDCHLVIAQHHADWGDVDGVIRKTKQALAR